MRCHSVQSKGPGLSPSHDAHNTTEAMATRPILRCLCIDLFIAFRLPQSVRADATRHQQPHPGVRCRPLAVTASRLAPSPFPRRTVLAPLDSRFTYGHYLTARAAVHVRERGGAGRGLLEYLKNSTAAATRTVKSALVKVSGLYDGNELVDPSIQRRGSCTKPVSGQSWWSRGANPSAGRRTGPVPVS